MIAKAYGQLLLFSAVSTQHGNIAFMKNNQKANNIALLLIGDWFIDEYWIVSKINSYHSSHTGDIHYSVQQKEITNSVMNYCGVPEIIEIIKARNKVKVKIGKRRKSIKLENLTCIGSWNPVDNAVIKCLLCREHSKEKFLTPYTLRSLKFPGVNSNNQKYSSKIVGQTHCLYNYSELCKFESNINIFNIYNDKKQETASTNRIIRNYDGFGGKTPHNINRIDWINKLDDSTGDKLSIEELLGKDVDFTGMVIHIIVEDHGMGVLSSKTINQLFNFLNTFKYQEVCWHIRTKMENPDWLKALFINIQHYGNENNCIETIVNDFKIQQKEKGIRKPWFEKTISRSSLELLGQMVGSPYYLHENPRPVEFPNIAKSAAILFEDNSIVGIERIETSKRSGTHRYRCFLYDNSKKISQPLTIGRTRKFFTAIVIKKIIGSIVGVPPKKFHEICNEASNFAYYWSELLREKWNEGNLNVFNYSEIIDAIFHKDSYFNNSLNDKSTLSNYDDLWKRWNESSKYQGIINQKSFDLWRGFGSLDDYITIGGSKRNAINDLINEIYKFSKQVSPEYSLSCLITAAPGWGKSFLAKCAAKKFKLEYLEFSVSQMATTKDFIGCLATISSVQSRNKDKKLLVFIDEINAEVEGHSIIPLMLSPIWDGVFINEGRSYRIDPCIWLFASTSDLNALSDSKNPKNNKGSDFASRLNGPILELDSLGAGILHEIVKLIRDDVNKFTGGDTEQFYTEMMFYENEILRLNRVENFFDDKSFQHKVYSQLVKDFKPSLSQLQEKKSPIHSALNNYFEYLSKDSKIKTEQVYIMVNYLNNKYKPIKKIERSVLNLFYNILPINGIRSLQFFADSFEEIENNEITFLNVPDIEQNQALKRHVLVPIGWFYKESRSIIFSDKSSKMINIYSYHQ